MAETEAPRVRSLASAGPGDVPAAAHSRISLSLSVGDFCSVLFCWPEITFESSVFPVPVQKYLRTYTRVFTSRYDWYDTVPTRLNRRVTRHVGVRRRRISGFVTVTGKGAGFFGQLSRCVSSSILRIYRQNSRGFTHICLPAAVGPLHVNFG